MWVSRKNHEAIVESFRDMVAYYKEEVARLSTENETLRRHASARVGAPIHQPYSPVQEKAPPRFVYSDDGLEAIQVEED